MEPRGRGGSVWIWRRFWRCFWAGKVKRRCLRPPNFEAPAMDSASGIWACARTARATREREKQRCCKEFSPQTQNYAVKISELRSLMLMRKRREKKGLRVPSDSGGEGAVRHLRADEQTVLICSSWNGRSESICLPRMHKPRKAEVWVFANIFLFLSI